MNSTDATGGTPVVAASVPVRPLNAAAGTGTERDDA